MNKLLTLLLALSTLAVSGALAQSKTRAYSFAETSSGSQKLNVRDVASDFSIIGSANIVSKYVFRGTKRNGFSIQPALTLAHKSGLYATGFANVPFESSSETEYNISVGGAFSFGKLTVDVGGVYYYTQEERAQADWSQECYVGLTYYLPANFGLRYYVYYDTRFEAVTNEFALGYSIPLTPRYSNIPASVCFSVYVGYTDGHDMLPEGNGGRARESYSYYGASVEIPVELTPRLSVSIGARYGQTRNYFESGSQDCHVWAFGSLTYPF